MQNYLIGLHFRKHDANISLYDGKKFNYLLFERQNGAKKHCKIEFSNRNINEYPSIEFENYLIKFLKKNNIDKSQIKSIAVGDSYWNLKAKNHKYEKVNYFQNICSDVYFVDHHYAHHLSNFSDNDSITLDGHGNDLRYLSIIKNNNIVKTLKDPEDGESIGAKLDEIGLKHLGSPYTAGHIMAWSALGKSNKEFYNKHKNDNFTNSFQYMNEKLFFKSWSKENNSTDNLMYDYIKTIHEIAKKTHLSYFKNFFNDKENFLFTGGVSQSIILNTYLKSKFKNMEITPHGYDGGISLGLIYFLIKKYDYDIPAFNNYPFIQSDEHPGYPHNETIKKTAEYLASGKIVLWYQGNGELGPRALGNRSILANPLVADIKNKINNKIKKRAWYRPYGASVLEEHYKEFFNLDWKSPYMLYQADVVQKDLLKSITHFDGTCRIQTVPASHTVFYTLLEHFQKLTGLPMLINTSFNLPGAPIVGSLNDAKYTFKGSLADVLVLGDEIYTK